MPENQTQNERDIQNMSQDEMLAVYAEQLMNEKGIAVTEAQKAELVEELNDYINTEILNAMSDAELTELDVLLDNPNTTAEQVDDLIGRAGMNVDEVVEKAMESFRKQYLSLKEER